MARPIDANTMKEELLWGNIYLSDNETNALADLIDEQPTIDPESLRPHGRWIQVESAWEQKQLECSCCGCKWPGYARFFAYCPCCGAKMENTDES